MNVHQSYNPHSADLGDVLRSIYATKVKLRSEEAATKSRLSSFLGQIYTFFSKYWFYFEVFYQSNMPRKLTI